jgi:hypothetical protein
MNVPFADSLDGRVEATVSHHRVLSRPNLPKENGPTLFLFFQHRIETLWNIVWN